MESDSAWEAFNVGTGIPSTVLSFYDTLAGALGKPKTPPTIRGTFRLGDVRHFAHDVKKLSALGWQASTSLRQGLERYSEWILSIAKVDNPFADAYAKLLRLNVVRIAE
jgi:dTDP-L-rhamnose 4-epimerase